MKHWLSLILICVSARAALAADVRQPVFLICPAEHGYSAWSVDLACDAADPSKIASISIDKLKHKNAKDAKFGDVVKAQSDSATEREQIATLSAKDFASGSLAVKKDEALTITLKASGNGDYHMAINLRVGAEEHFFIGGKEQDKRDVVLHYDKAKKKWGAFAATLQDATGKNAISGGQKPMLGLVFPVNQASGISKLIAVINADDAVVLYEKPDTSPQP